MLTLLDSIVLRRDTATSGLCSGDVRAIAEVYDGESFEVEFVLGSGRTQALLSISPRHAVRAG